MNLSASETQILYYFLHDEAATAMSKREHRLNQHRQHNIRYRQKKQEENQRLKDEALTLEVQLQDLIAKRKKPTLEHDGKTLEDVRLEKRKRIDAESENTLLKNSIAQYQYLVELYYKRIDMRQIKYDMVSLLPLSSVENTVNDHLAIIFIDPGK